MKPLAFRSDADVTAALGPAIAHLRAGRLLAYPTETVYGLGSRAREDDVRALAELKGRRADKPFLLLVSSREMAEAAERSQALVHDLEMQLRETRQEHEKIEGRSSTLIQENGLLLETVTDYRRRAAAKIGPSA